MRFNPISIPVTDELETLMRRTNARSESSYHIARLSEEILLQEGDNMDA